MLCLLVFVVVVYIFALFGLLGWNFDVKYVCWFRGCAFLILESSHLWNLCDIIQALFTVNFIPLNFR